MNPLAPVRRQVLLALGALALAPLSAHAADPALPGNSLYQLSMSLTDQDGRTVALSAARGHPVLASMFYTSCPMVCPLIFETIGLTLAALPPAERARVRVLMVSFDPQRDTVAELKKVAQAHGCDERWTVARTTRDADVRALAALLGVQYRRLPEGDFNHSSAIELLDAEGRIAARTSTLGAVEPDMIQALHAAVALS